MNKVGVRKAKKHLFKLLERFTLGEKIIITRAGEPVAKLSPLGPRRAHKRTPGGAEGLRVPDSFFEPLPDNLFAEQLDAAELGACEYRNALRELAE